MRSYYILNNGGWPYIIDIDNTNNIFIIRKNNNDITKIYESKFIKKFLGKHTDGTLLGNSILFLIFVNDIKTVYQYIYIGTEIYSFTHDTPITKYYSPIGNSNVCYPYATSKNKTLLMLDKCILDSNLIDNNEDVYGYYYRTYVYSKKDKISYPSFKNIQIIFQDVNKS
jgi:hypothetical protein